MAMATVKHRSQSRMFCDFIRAIGNSKTKQDEDATVLKELGILKRTMSQPNVGAGQMRELVVRMVYCEMLGHPADFGCIHAVKLMASQNLFEKRVGYLGVTLCIRPENELAILAVAPMQKDLQSTNYLEVCVALGGCCKMLTAEMIPCLLPTVQQLLKHPQAVVRKKAVAAIHAFYKIDEASIGEDLHPYRATLADKDPSVANAALHLLYEFALKDPSTQKDLVPALVSVLKQVIEHRLAREYDYHRIPAPWMQIQLLRLIGLLCADDEHLSDQVYEVVLETIKRADAGISMGTAIIYECVSCITTIWPNSTCLEAAASSISGFISSHNPNLKYLGIKCLSAIVRVDIKYVQPHQETVMSCLKSADKSIKHQTLQLLYAITTGSNLKVIINRLIKFLANNNENHVQADVVKHICELSEKFCENDYSWYVDILIQVMQCSAQHVPPAVVQGFLRLIAEGIGEDEEEDQAFRVQCVRKLYNKLDENVSLSDLMCKVIAWVVGEYGFLLTDVHHKAQVDRLCDLVERRYNDIETKGWVVSGLMKCVSQRCNDPLLQQQVTEVTQYYQCARNTDLQQRAWECKVLLDNPTLFSECLPLDGACEDVSDIVDSDLTFLDPLVQDCLAKGWKDYVDTRRDHIIFTDTESKLHTTAYPDHVPSRYTEDLHQIEKQKDSLMEESTTLHFDKHKARWPYEGMEDNKGTTTTTTTTEEEEQEKEEEIQLNVPRKPKKKAKKPKKLTKAEVEEMVLFGKITPKEGEKLLSDQKKKMRKDQPTDEQESNITGGENTAQRSLECSTLGAPSDQFDEPFKRITTSTTDVLDDFFSPLTVAPANNPMRSDFFSDISPPRTADSTSPCSPSMYPPMSSENTVINTPNVKLWFHKNKQAEDSLVIDYYLQAVQERIGLTVIQFTPPTAFNIEVECNQPGTTKQSTTLNLQYVDTSQPTVIHVKFRGVTNLELDTVMYGQMAYFNSLAQQENRSFQTRLDIADFIRRGDVGAITTEEFGQLWLTNSAEVKIGLMRKFDVATLAAALTSSVSLQCIQQIGSEVILIGNILGKQDVVVLVHAFVPGVDGAGVVTIRSANVKISDMVKETVAPCLV